ncbi:hypothetical protein NDU88_007891 [Pleurodeles waltl]|uniref:Uncharacterized protein n=1 Tax=Pleurodeles waltl TaxID=8319 RepID=A0AAV7RU52_PLEWA|nr:hypothetical protein NDU88_007891 [Pleurodeles waltl]
MRRTRKKEKHGRAHQPRTTEDREATKEKNVQTKGKEAPRRVVTWLRQVRPMHCESHAEQPISSDCPQ